LAKRLQAAGALDGVARVGLAIDRAKAGDYAAADAYLADIKGEGLERFLKPMLRSWTQLELSGLDAAEKTLQPLGAVNGFEPLYQLQLGLLADKAGKSTEAAEHYAKAMQLANEQAFRMVEIVANFDLRFPLAYPERGFGSWPVFLRSIHSAVFFDACICKARLYIAVGTRGELGNLLISAAYC